MSDMAVLTEVFMYILGALLVLAGLGAVVTEIVVKYRRNKRRYRRLYETGYRFSTKDFK